MARVISAILHKYGDAENKFLIALSDVWLNGGEGDINVYIENDRIFIKTKMGFKYSIFSLKNCEIFSILYKLEEYEENVKEMLNSEYNLDVSF